MPRWLTFGLIGCGGFVLLVLVLFVGIFIGTSGTDAPINPPADSALEERESEEGAEQASGSADTFTRDNYAGLVADPAAHEGAAVEITGQLLGSPEANGGETAFQMYADPQTPSGTRSCITKTPNWPWRPTRTCASEGR